MSFPNYSSLFTLGLSSSSSAAGPSRTTTKKPTTTTTRRRSRAHSLKSFLKLDTRTEPAPPMPALPIVTPHTPIESPSSPKSQLPAAPLMCRRSRETLRSIPSPKPVPSMQTLPTPPMLGLPLPLLSPSSSPMSSVSTLPPSTPPPRESADSIPVPPAMPSRKSSSALGLGLAGAPKQGSGLRHRPSVAASSVASPRRRRVQRSAALANLEGRHGKSQQPRNFMSMSDDEDDVVPVQQPNSAPTSPVSHRPEARRERALSDVSSLVLRADFLDFSPLSSPSLLKGDAAEDGFLALDAALFAALEMDGCSKPQTFSSFIDVTA